MNHGIYLIIALMKSTGPASPLSVKVGRFEVFPLCRRSAVYVRFPASAFCLHTTSPEKLEKLQE